jgi:hypothetical protein
LLQKQLFKDVNDLSSAFNITCAFFLGKVKERGLYKASSPSPSPPPSPSSVIQREATGVLPFLAAAETEEEEEEEEEEEDNWMKWN